MLQISSKCKSNDKNNCQKFIIVNEKNVTICYVFIIINPSPKIETIMIMANNTFFSNPVIN